MALSPALAEKVLFEDLGAAGFRLEIAGVSVRMTNDEAARLAAALRSAVAELAADREAEPDVEEQLYQLRVDLGLIGPMSSCRSSGISHFERCPGGHVHVLRGGRRIPHLFAYEYPDTPWKPVTDDDAALLPSRDELLARGVPFEVSDGWLIHTRDELLGRGVPEEIAPGMAFWLSKDCGPDDELTLLYWQVLRRSVFEAGSSFDDLLSLFRLLTRIRGFLDEARPFLGRLSRVLEAALDACQAGDEARAVRLFSFVLGQLFDLATAVAAKPGVDPPSATPAPWGLRPVAEGKGPPGRWCRSHPIASHAPPRPWVSHPGLRSRARMRPLGPAGRYLSPGD